MATIEHTFPTTPLGELARLESYNKHYYRPANYVHKWWARRLGSVFRTILLALFSDENDIWSKYYEHSDFDGKIVVDPFVGGGTTIVEALRLGCKAVGSDLNPVAWWTTKQAITPISPKRLDKAFNHVQSQVQQTIQDLYQTACPDCSETVPIVYVLWVKLAPCVDCGEFTPLQPDYILRYENRREAIVLCPTCSHIFGPELVRLSDSSVPLVQCPRCDHQFDPSASPVHNSTFSCQSCEHEQTVLDATQTAQQILSERMFALRYACPTCGDGFKEPSEEDKAAFQSCVEYFDTHRDDLLFPRQSIMSGLKTDDLLRHEYRYWHELFNERQLIAIDSLLRAILSVDDKEAREMLLTLFSSTLEFNNMFCSYKGGAPSRPGAVRHIFSHHAFVLPHQPLENNLWGVNNSSGSFSALYRRLRRSREFAQEPEERVVVDGKVAEKVQVHGEEIAARFADTFSQLQSDDNQTNALLLCRDSSHLPIPDNSVDAVVTDPPYFDNVQYAELADFFYVWLRLALKDVYEEFAGTLTPKSSEVVKNTRRAKDSQSYQLGLRSVFEESYRILNDDGFLVFTFHHKQSDAWETVLQSVLDAGFYVRATYPVFAEMSRSIHIYNQEAMEYDAIIVCKKQPRPEPITWQQLEKRIQSSATHTWRQLVTANGHIKPIDASVIVMGKCLEFYSQHYPLVTDTGSQVDVGEAIHRMEYVVTEVIRSVESEDEPWQPRLIKEHE